MKKLLLITISLLMVIQASASTDTISSVVITYPNESVVTTIITRTPSDHYLVQSTDELGMSTGPLLIATNPQEFISVLEVLDFFFTMNLDFVMFPVNDSIYLKVDKGEPTLSTASDDYQITDDFPPIITDGTDIFADLAHDLVKTALSSVKNY